MNLHEYKNIHFIGIGGIGVSAIAKMMLLEGKKVSGSDLSSSLITDKLKNEGVDIFIGPHNKENLPDDSDLVIYSIAIQELDPNNSELLEAKKRNIPLLTYPEALGRISKTKKTVAISGTHGKTTTTGMIAEIFLMGKMDPTVVIGSFLKKNGDYENFVAGKSDWLIAEACEYKKSFLNLSPHILIITNIDNDHLDYYGTLENVQKAFTEFVEKVPEGGFIVTNPNDLVIKPTLSKAKGNIIDYTMYPELSLKVSGAHNRKNAQAAYAVGNVAGIDKTTIEEALKNFSGTWRRQEYKGKTKTGAIVHDDYAHHPTEIKATISGFRELYPDKKLTVIFQPHLYSRTKLLFDDFVEALSTADRVIITDIYAAREKKDNSISGEMLANSIASKNNSTLFTSSFSDIEKELTGSLGNDDVIITMGAGDVYKIGEDLVNQ